MNKEPEKETCGSIALMLATAAAIVVVAVYDEIWQKVKRLLKKDNVTGA